MVLNGHFLCLVHIALKCHDHALKRAGDLPQAIAQRERCVKAMQDAIGVRKGHPCEGVGWN